MHVLHVVYVHEPVLVVLDLHLLFVCVLRLRTGR